jgi:hypothetical protein
MDKPLVIYQAEDTQLDIPMLWALMPDANKVYYDNDINVYAQHKIAQAIKDEAYTDQEFHL